MQLTEPKTDERAAQAYVSIHHKVPMSELPRVIPDSIRELFGWLGRVGVKPAGAPFAKYNVIDMERGLEIEIGIPVGSAVSGDARVKSGTLPAGRYASLVHTGPPPELMAANAALQDWAKEKGLRWKLSGERWSARLEHYLTDPAEQPDMNKWETEVAYQLAE